MIINSKELTPQEQIEQDVREYFEYRGWKVKKLDKGNKKAADFRVYNSNMFLCEVKTITSVRANFPFTRYDWYCEERKKRQDEIKKWVEENPSKHLVLGAEDIDFVCGDENEFEKRYRLPGRNTEAHFNEFRRTMKGYFADSSIKDLPYNLIIDSYDLYVPTKDEQEKFFKWLEGEIKAIDERNTSRHWQISRLSECSMAWYLASYKIHRCGHDNDIEVKYELRMEGPYEHGPFEVNGYSYGVLNLDAIKRNIEYGVKQLESSASRENDKQIPRIIVLAFQSEIGFEWQYLSSFIVDLLKNNTSLSAIAVLIRIPDGTLPPEEDGFLAWIKFHAMTSVVRAFYVYHNSWLQDVKPLPAHVFSDKWSIQLCPIR